MPVPTICLRIILLGGSPLSRWALLFLLGFAHNATAALGFQESASNHPWDAPLFTTGPHELLAAAARVPGEAGRDALQLMRETIYRFDAAGRLETRQRWVYRILTDSGLETWARSSVEWSPRRQHRPEMRVRVVNLDGSVNELDPANIVEQDNHDLENDVFSDRKTLIAPISGAAAGSVVEEETVVRDKAPFFAAGMASINELREPTTTLKRRIVVDIPESLPFQYRVFERDRLRTSTVRQYGRVRHIFELENPPLYEGASESDLPRHFFGSPYVIFSTGTSWRAVAKAYHRLVEEKLESQDLKKTARPLKGKTREQTALNMLRWIDSQVRYTNMALGEGAIAPVSPSDTLDRKFGDCKDLATLLVGMLRAVGLRADVALVRANSTFDIPIDLPGLGLFNHAMVYVHGKKPLWLDPTLPPGRALFISSAIEGRLALIVNPKTDTLTRIPPHVSGDNSSLRRYEIRLADSGFGKIKETWRESPEQEAYLSRSYREMDSDSMRAYLQSHINKEHRFGNLTTVNLPEQTDYRNPWLLSFEAEKMGRALTDERSAVAAVLPASVLEDLPEALLAKDADPRQSPFFFHSPFINERVYHITPPLGFIPTALPQSESLSLGALRLDIAFQRGKANDVIARLRLDTGKRELTAAEFDVTRQTVAAFVKRQGALVRFEHEVYPLLEAGKYPEALNRFRQLAEKEPEKAIHRLRHAKTLLRAGLGEQARAIARAAEKLDPDSAKVQLELANILRHDLFGRKHYPGFDRAGAAKALRRAMELDSKNLAYPVELAILLEFDTDGERYGPQADLAEASALYANAASFLEERGLLRNWAMALLHLNDFAKLHEAAQRFPKAEKYEYELTAIAALEGPKAALKRARAIASGPQRDKLLAKAGVHLLAARKYSESGVLMSAAAKGMDRARQMKSIAAVLKKTRRIDRLTFSNDDPVDIIKQSMIALLQGGDSPATLEPWVTPLVYREIESDPEAPDLLANGLSPRVLGVPKYMTVRGALDLICSNMICRLEGDARIGWKAVASIRLLDKYFQMTFFLDAVDGKPRLAAIAGAPGSLGSTILDMLEAGRTEAAGQWLQWLAEDMKPILDQGDALEKPSFITILDSMTDETGLRLAAASLAVEGSSVEKAVSILEKAVNGGASRKLRSAIEASLFWGYAEMNQGDQMMASAKRLLELYPDSEKAEDLYVMALIRVDDIGGLKTLAQKKLARDPKDWRALRFLMKAHLETLAFEAHRQALVRLEEHGVADAGDYNNSAWLALFQPELPEYALEHARRAVVMAKGENWAMLHTLATVYAEAGHCQQARQMILKAMAANGQIEPSADDWYVLGRISEHYGEREAAFAAFARVEPPKPEHKRGAATYVLAQRRLRALGDEN